MVVAFMWRLRFEDEIFGPAARVQLLLPIVQYMPPETVWEYLDANGDWIEYIDMQEWRRLLKVARKAYNPNGDESESEASVEENYLTLTYNDFHKQHSQARLKYKRIVNGVMHGSKNLQIHPYNYWIKYHPEDREKWEQKAKESVKTGYEKLLENCPDGRVTKEWEDGLIWESAIVRERKRQAWRAAHGRTRSGRKK